MNRAQLDALFAEPEQPHVVAVGPAYHYPLQTFCGIAWREPVTDHNAADYCRKCRYLTECRELVAQRNGLALCEIVLGDDLIPEGVFMAHEIWECFGHGVPGLAIVSASSRALALRTCFEWLGWKVAVAFRKPERFTLWVNCGGTETTPVVYGADGEHFAAMESRVTDDREKYYIDAETASTEMVYWEDKL